MKHLPAVMIAVFLSAFCSCSQDDDATGTLIGPEGGTVSAAGGAVLQIPPGALDREVEVWIEEAAGSPAGFNPAGGVYEFGPPGTVFAEPVEVRLPYDQTRVRGPESGVRVWWALSIDGDWAPLEGSADTTQDTVTGLATHFSFGAPGEPETCQPDCAGRECGPDGCGGSCPPGCGAVETCDDTTGTCECTHETCGDDCCAAGEVCHSGSCCLPSCDGKQCGDDGCGGSCGTCGENQTCSAAGTCECAHEACGTECCAAGEVCHSGSCCLPSCDGKQCGDDGCGGDCGTCDAGKFCSAAGTCVDCLTEADCEFLQFCTDGVCQDATRPRPRTATPAIHPICWYAAAGTTCA